MKNEKSRIIIGVTTILSITILVVVAMFTRKTTIDNSDAVLVKGVITDIIDDKLTPSYDYYKCRTVEVLSNDTIRAFLNGTYFYVNRKDNFYEKGDIVTTEFKLPKKH